VITFAVIGTPVPQGSKSARVIGEEYEKRGEARWVKNPRAHLTDGFGDKMRRLKAWRESVAEMAFAAMKCAGVAITDRPVVVTAIFYLPRSQAAAKKLFHDTRPDVDKLQRAVGDALKGVVYTEDSRIVKWFPEKKFADEWAARAPGVALHIRPAGIEDVAL
jgi:Holliday junction resolvase RusA-like endonuclease